MRKIFLIGGGEIAQDDTSTIDKKIIREGLGSQPRILFFPTAANDNQKYIDIFFNYFFSLGQSNITVARLTKESTWKIREKIRSSKIIYLGGGNTMLLIKHFKKNNLDADLKKYVLDNKIIAGMSAGAIAMCQVSVVSENNEKLKFEEGFGILPEIICLPHYHHVKHKKRLLEIKSMFPKKEVIPIPERTAVYIKGEKRMTIK